MKNSTIGLNSVAIAMLMVISSSVQAIVPSKVSASSSDGHVEQNTIDDDLTTRWSANGNNGSQWIQYDFTGKPNLSSINIAFHKGDVRSTRFQIHSSNDGQNWQIKLSARSSGKTAKLEKFTFDTLIDSPYIRIVGFGNNQNTWNSITEVTFEEAKLIPTLDDAIAIASADDGNVAGNVIDGRLDTRWSALGSGQWLRLDLGSEQTLSNVKLAFFKGDARAYNFSIETSLDDRNWGTAITQTASSGKTIGLETFTLPNISARYVRFTGYGNPTNNWNSLTEFSVTTADGLAAIQVATVPVVVPKPAPVVVATPAPAPVVARVATPAVVAPVPVAPVAPVAIVPIPVTSTPVYPVSSDLSSVDGVNCTLTVNNPTELKNNTGWNMPAGTTICLADGIYDSVDLQIGGAGTRDYPIMVAAITQGNVFFETKSKVRVAGSYIVLKGIIFQNGYSISRDLIKTSNRGCKYCRLSEITIQNWDADKNKKWFSSWNL